MKIDGIGFSKEATKLTLQEFKETFAGRFNCTNINVAYKMLHAHFGTKAPAVKTAEHKKVTHKGGNGTKRRSSGYSTGSVTG